MPTPSWRLWIDTGGTFTDCIGLDPAGAIHRAKVLSSSALRARISARFSDSQFRIHQAWNIAPSVARGMTFRNLSRPADHAVVADLDPAAFTITLSHVLREAAPGDLIELSADEEAPILAARILTGTAPGDPLPPIAMRLGTTRGTNALLERRGGRTALFLTAGLGDLLEIGTQQRPDIFALNIIKPAPLYETVIEVPGRLAADGAELTPLDTRAIEEPARRALASGVRSAAVALMHSWLDPRHERALRDALLVLGFDHVSLSSDLAPLIKILPRAQTTLVNAYLSPVIDSYVSRIERALARSRPTRPAVPACRAPRSPEPAPPPSSLHLMASAGGLVRATEFYPKDSLLSGPAGGVVGAAAAGLAAGFPRTIAFDMGGTSTDASRFDGQHSYTFEHEVAGAQIVAPALAIESVAAGGGSICRVKDGALSVGPESAGASPGPACYGAGGPLTITDCNLLLGRLDPAGFGIPLDERPARTRLTELLADLRAQTNRDHDADETLEGLIDIANERMAAAIAQVSIRQGYDPAEYALVCFGGAGAQHACGIARRLNIRTVVVPADAGLLSALGLGAAPIERFAERQVLRPLDGADLESILNALAAAAAADVARQGVAPEHITTRRRIATLRLAGQDSSIPIECDAAPTAAALAAAFRHRYRSIYGHEPPDRAIELEALRVIAGSQETAPSSPATTAPTARPHAIAHRRMRIAGQWVLAPIFCRADLSRGANLAGPALITESHTTTFVEPGWNAALHDSGALILSSTGHSAAQSTSAAARLEISTGRLLSIARDMGEMLRRTALSTNVKERLDFSCAILDADARLVVNAPHIPVHLGALGVCVRRVRESLPLARGDVAVTNHPAFGGSHLPDITVITPVFTDDQPAPIAFVACRAHHAELGGTRPGSMPTDATRLIEEGVVIPPMHLVKAGQPQWEPVERLLNDSTYPSGAPAENLADLRAQVAANHHGVAALQAFVRDSGPDELRRATQTLTDRADRGARRAATALAARSSTFSAEERLDDGSPIRVRIGAAPDRLTIDFAGSAPVHPGNLNATAAIIRSATMYVLRLLIDEPLPLNEGLLRCVDLRIPMGMLNPEFRDDPALCPAVAGGNVETSQRTVDTLLKALGLAACSQGTMNNTLFGNDRFGYYETICGGAGATPAAPGASAVHTHMTNTRITDPELLEHRYPVRLDRFSIRRGSGGDGLHKGGDGVTREITFLARCSLSLLTQHRTAGPYGAAGGSAGEPGVQRLLRGDGRVEVLVPIAGQEVGAGDTLIIQTPGGGGWGAVSAPVQSPPGPVAERQTQRT